MIGNSFFRSMPPVTKNLIIVNVIIWVAMMLFPAKIGAPGITYCGLHYFTAGDFNPMQLVTYMFVHSTDSLVHLFFNMFALFMFGTTLERVLGSKRFLFYYLSCGIGAALVQEAVWALTLESTVGSAVEMSLANWAHANNLSMAEVEQLKNTPQLAREIAELREYIINSGMVTIGASGAIYGVLLAFGMLFPNLPLYIMFIPVPIKAKWVVIGYGVIELALGLLSFRDGVAHFAHLGGMIFGFLLILYWKRKGVAGGGYY